MHTSATRPLWWGGAGSTCWAPPKPHRQSRSRLFVSQSEPQKLQHDVENEKAALIGSLNPQHSYLLTATNPAGYCKQWGTVEKLRLDALWSAVNRTSNSERLLLLLDELLMYLRSCRSLAVHLQQHHTDPTWAAAGQQVAADCSRYERYIYSNRSVTKRLQGLQSSLLERQHSNLFPQQATVHPASILSPKQQLELCNVLLKSMHRDTAEDSMQWLAALELPDTNVEQVQQLQVQERSLVAAIDRVLGQPVSLQLPPTLVQHLQPQQSDTSQIQPCQPSMNVVGSTDSSISGSSSNGLGTDASGTAADESVTIQHPPSAALHQQQEYHSHQQQQQPVVVSITKGLLVRLLQQCPDPDVRQQLHEQLLQPKLQQASHLLAQLARCRAQHARLAGYDSFYSMTQQCLQAAASSRGVLQDGTEHKIGFLIKLQEALEPLCQREVAWVSEQAGRQYLVQQGHLDDDHTQRQQQQPQQQQHDSSQPARGGSAILQGGATSDTAGHFPQQGVGSAAHQQTGTCSDTDRQSGPADWDYLLHQATLPYSQLLQREAALLQQHLQLFGVVAGLSSLLQDLIGVRLVPRAAAAAAAATPAAYLWAPHLLVLDVFDVFEIQGVLTGKEQQQDGHLDDMSKQRHSIQGGRVKAGLLLGTVYLDISGGYGTRMLRYARNVPGSSSRAAASRAAHSLPAVAVGVSGTRLPPVKQHGQLASAGVSTGAPAAAAAGRAAHALPAVAVGVSGPRLPPVVQQGQLAGAPTAAAAGTGCLSSGALIGSEVAGGGQVGSWDASLSVSQLWELAHELGHAVHLVASSRQPACHLSGRFLPLQLLELPSQLMERLMLQPNVLARVCLHQGTKQQMPAHLAAALGDYYGSRYNTALAVSARVAASLAELMYGVYGGDMQDYWRGAWEAAAGLPAGVAATGSLREVSLLPVLAAHQGTYHCYLLAWIQAAQVYEQVLQPLLQMQAKDGTQGVSCHKSAAELQAAARAVFTAHVDAQTTLTGEMSPGELVAALWQLS